MWACPDDLAKMFADLPPPPLVISSDKDLNVGELVYIPREQLLKQRVEDAMAKWNNVGE
jgi:hypothetical protein